MNPLYEPAEDSFLLWKVTQEFLEKNAFPGMKILDVGTGSGFLIRKVSQFLKGREISAELWASDLAKVKFPGIHSVISDLFQNIPGKFDLILFNPPYLPADETDACLGKERRNLIGGKKGNEVVMEFLEQLPDHLENKGTCLLIFSSLSHPEELEKKSQEQGFSCQKIAEESFPFEKIKVMLLSKVAIHNLTSCSDS